jgi:hypothetical protein
MASGDSKALADAIFRANVNLVDKDTTRRATEQLQMQIVSVACNTVSCLHLTTSQ